MRNRTGPWPQSAADVLPRRPPLPSTGGGAAEQEATRTLNDSLLAIRAAEGDEDAFAVLVRRHTSRLLALSQQLLGNRPDAEDAVQEAFLSAWRRLPEFQHTATFGTWMYRIVINRCLSTLRRRPPLLPLDGVPEPAAADADSSPSRRAEIDAAAAALTAALQRLSPELRACWVLRELHGLHYEEIAHVTDSSEQTVRGRLFRARRALTEAMRPWR
ncbi:RNA polymerase sigma factor [Streptomyces sp. A0592]|uniref:RNA polymerase sigma factor n=1 Tax=Streptomyces sp. A0592 TaxID=2563099 RepID=UPI00109ED7B3|nr:RNA polymerase sigma factor [Streptomyces sp. A0592]THA75443.1 RNA polymerase sigma factor [Streptomyces sp. A0592]